LKQVVVVGGGIAGLSIAHALINRTVNALDIDVLVLEQSNRLGGNIRTDRVNGYLCERGPIGFLDSAPATLSFVRELDLESELLPASETAKRRYVLGSGKLRPVPSSLLGVMRTGLLSNSAKARLLAEPLARRRTVADESIYDFARRRIGGEAADVLVDAIVSGVFAGDARQLSLAACFPRMREMEDKYRSLVRAMLARRRDTSASQSAGGPLGRLTSFSGGMSLLADRAAAALGDRVRVNTGVLGIRPTGNDGYCLRTTRGDDIPAHAVILAGHPTDSATAVHTLDPVAGQELTAIRSAPVVAISLGYTQYSIPVALDGFGFLAPRREKLRTLGALWESSIFPNRAPDGRVLMRLMIGGAHDPGAIELGDSEITGIALGDLRQSMGLTAEPEMVSIFRHRRGIPQYEIGHLERISRVRARLRAHGPIFLAGSGFDGVSVNDCIRTADAIAATVIATL